MCDEAVQRLAHVAGRMLELTPPHMLARLRGAEASFAVIGRDQRVTGVCLCICAFEKIHTYTWPRVRRVCCACMRACILVRPFPQDATPAAVPVNIYANTHMQIRSAIVIVCALTTLPPVMLTPADMPPHRFMRHAMDRDLDRTARGLGATPSVPCTSAPEENLVMEADRCVG